MNKEINPFEQLLKAKKLSDMNNDPLAGICFLATTQYDKSPHVRSLQTYDIIDGAIFLLVSDTSPKWEQLTSSATYEALFYWPSVSVQARLCGAFFMAERKITEKYWSQKSYRFKSLDLYHSLFEDQSRRQTDKSTFLKNLNHIKELYPDSVELSLPDHIKGIYLVPTEIEIWMDDAVDNIPVRYTYTLKEDLWHEAMLVP